MSCNRRLTLRKGKSSSNDGNQSISSFVQRRSKDVEIIENDEVVQMTDEYDFSDAQTVQRPLRRKKKRIAVLEESENEDDNDSLELEEGLTEAEKQQLKEAMRQSRVEHEKYEKRREIYEKIFQNSKTEIPTPSTDIPSSPERAESPDLFGPTPQSNAEQYKKYDITSSEPSSMTNDLSSIRQKSPLKKEISIQINPIQRPLPKYSNAVTSEDRGKIDSKKRKHTTEHVSDDDTYDGTKENIKSPLPSESRKRQKTIEDNFSMLTAKKENKEQIKEPETKHFVIPDDDTGDSTGSNVNRNASTKKPKKYCRVSLKRKYKPRRPIKTMKDAMKARLFFAPPGIDQNLYAFAIMRMLDHAKDKVRKAYQRNGQFVKWGLPVVPGPREGDTLDAKKVKRNSYHTRKESLDQPEFKTRSSRKLWNTQLKDETTVRAEASNPKNIKTGKESIERLTKSDDFDTSDDSDQELTKSVFGNKENYPKSWKEYSSKTDSYKFGENVNISASRVEKDNVVKSDKNVDNRELKKDKEGLTATLNPDHKEMPFDSSEMKLDRAQTTTKLGNTDEKELFQDADSTHADVYFKDNDISNADSNQESMIDNKYTKESKDHNVCTDNDNSPVTKKSFNQSKIQESDLDTNDSEDGIDSSVEIGKLRAKRHSHKAAVIEDDEEETACDRNSKGDIEMVDIDDLTPQGLNTSKPGDALSTSASKSGYLKVNRSENKPPLVQRKVTTAALKAAEAAEKRMKKQEKVAKPSGSEVSNETPLIEEDLCQCPICYLHFPLQDIELHADACNGSPPELDESGKHSRRVIATKQGLESPMPVKTQEYGLKDLRVMMTRSPEAEKLHKEQENSPGFKTKRNLSLTKRVQRDVEKVIVDTTSDDDVDVTEQGSSKSQNKGDSQGSHGLSWLTTNSQEARKKAKFKITYGGKKKIAPQKNPFSTLEYIPLREPSPSSDSETDHKTVIKSHKTLPASSGLETTANDPLSGASQDKNYLDIDSDSSDAEMLSKYGHKMSKAVRNINDVLCPQKQDLTYKKKKKAKKDDIDDANERVLMELAGISPSSSSDDPQSKSVIQPKALKRRCKRATISSDDSDDEYMLCFACNKQVLKEVYCEHTNICTERKAESLSASSNRTYGEEASTANTSTYRNSTRGQTARQRTSNVVEMDSDEIGNSPIKTFKLIGEGDSSTVDYENQFAFLEGNNSRSSSRRGSKQSLRGRGRGRFKNKYWRNKKKFKQ